MYILNYGKERVIYVWSKIKKEVYVEELDSDF